MPWKPAKKPGGTTAGGWGHKHQQLRKLLLPKAYGTPCVRCGEIMYQGQILHLDHNDRRDGWLGFSHADCNLRAAAKKARAKQIYGQRPTTVHRW
jgi:hypothetical protein